MAAAAAAPSARSRRRRQGRQPLWAALLAVSAWGLMGGARPARAQNVTTYAVRLGGAGGDDVARGVGLDGFGSAFVVGSFRSPVFAVGQRTSLTNAGAAQAAGAKARDSDAFVAKLTRFGQLAWAIALGGWGDDAAAAVAVEPGSNSPAYVVGRFSSAELVLRAPNGTAAQAMVKAPDEKTWTALGNALVAKVDTKGAVAWALQLGGADGDEAATAVAMDAAQGRVFVAGTFASSALPLGRAATLQHAGGPAADGFVAALSAADGSVQWAVGLRGSGSDRPTGLAVDAASGSVYVVGVSDSPTLAVCECQEPAALLGEGAPTAFVARLQGATGALDWVRALNAAPAAEGVDPEVAVAADDTLLVLLGQEPPLPAVVAFEGATGEPRWEMAAAGAQRLAVDAAGASAYVAGVFAEPLALDDVTLAATAERGGDLYMARLDAATGRVEAGASFNGGDSAEKAVADLALDTAGSVYLAGSFSDGGLGFSTTLRPAAAAGDVDAFLARVAMGTATVQRAPTRRPTNAPTAVSAAAMATWSTLSVEEGAAAADVATAADDNADSSSSSTGDAIPVPSGSKENLIALFSYAGPMEKVPYLQDAVYLLLHDFSSFMAYLTPGVRAGKANSNRKLRGHRRQQRALPMDIASTSGAEANPCADPGSPRIDVPFFVAPADGRAAGDIQNLLDGVLGGEIPLRFAGLQFDRAELCDVKYGPTTLDASFFVPSPEALADDDVAGGGGGDGHGGIATIDGIINNSGDAQVAANEVMSSAHSFFGSKLYLFVAIGAGGGGLLLLWLVGWLLWKRWRGEQHFTPKRRRMSNTMAPGTAKDRMHTGLGTPDFADNVSVLTEGTISHAHSSHHRRGGSYHSQAAPPLQLPAAAMDASQQMAAIGAEEAATLATEQGQQNLAGLGLGGSSRLLVSRPARASSRSTPPPVFVPSIAGGVTQPQSEAPIPCPVREDTAAANAAPPAQPRSPLLSAVASLFGSKPATPTKAPAVSPNKVKAAEVSPGTQKRREEEAERVRRAEEERERQRAEQEEMERQIREAAALRRKQEEEAEAAAAAAMVEAARVKAEREAVDAKDRARKEKEAAEAMKKRQQQEAADAAARLKAEKEAEEKARKEKAAAEAVLKRKQEEEARIAHLKEVEEARLKKEREMAEALRRKKEAEEAARVQAQKEAEERQLQYQREREEKERRLQELLRVEQEERRQRREKEKQQLSSLAKQIQHQPQPPSGKAPSPTPAPAPAPIHSALAAALFKHAPGAPGASTAPAPAGVGVDDLIGPVGAWDVGGADDAAEAAAEAEAARVRAYMRPEVLAEWRGRVRSPLGAARGASPSRPAPLPLGSPAPPAQEQAQHHTPGSRGLPSYLMPTNSSSTKQRGAAQK